MGLKIAEIFLLVSIFVLPVIVIAAVVWAIVALLKRNKRSALPQAMTAERGRFSTTQKKNAVLRLLEGEELGALSRELGVTVAVLSEWREMFLAGAETHLKSREQEPADDEVLRLKAMVGELMLKNELLAEKSRLSEDNTPGMPLRK
ncbi:transposase [Comamonas sp. JC664]|uniref:transposase n=1 Tax=Comamonas sp. JC664 TaxID=2801917 RepID=UPI00174C13C5|nr:transposase [Comamonas sp. JC664]MBL0698563.1 transposase [Comamonas sp. JC664]GHH00495.1 hypothetical protein GCM10012319_67690 [Comamonas sp. KCTC 72670]